MNVYRDNIENRSMLLGFLFQAAEVVQLKLRSISSKHEANIIAGIFVSLSCAILLQCIVNSIFKDMFSYY